MPTTKTTKKAPAKKAAPKKSSRKAAPKKKAAKGNAQPQATKQANDEPLPDPCAAGHQWDVDGDGEFCTVCRADRAVIEREEKKAQAKREPKTPKAAGQLSAIDAAAKVLAEAGHPMNTKEMIEAMAAKGYWTSPAGKTPAATLYSAIIREIGTKGTEARFAKTERGKFEGAK